MPVVQVRLFAALREMAGSSRIEVDAGDVAAVCDQLSKRFGPGFGRILDAGSVVVEGRVVGRNHVLSSGQEVALLPPVSGGFGIFGPAVGFLLS